MVKLAKNYKKYIDDESTLSKEELEIRNYGQIDPKRHLEEHSEVLNSENIVQCLSAMLSTIVFQWICVCPLDIPLIMIIFAKQFVQIVFSGKHLNHSSSESRVHVKAITFFCNRSIV